MSQTLGQRLDRACGARGWQWATFPVELSSRTHERWWALAFEPPQPMTSKDSFPIFFVGDQLRDAGLDPERIDRTGRIEGTAIVAFVGTHPRKTALKVLLEIVSAEAEAEASNQSER
jgi:hypothetical protein